MTSRDRSSPLKFLFPSPFKLQCTCRMGGLVLRARTVTTHSWSIGRSLREWAVAQARALFGVDTQCSLLHDADHRSGLKTLASCSRC